MCGFINNPMLLRINASPEERRAAQQCVYGPWGEKKDRMAATSFTSRAFGGEDSAVRFKRMQQSKGGG